MNLIGWSLHIYQKITATFDRAIKENASEIVFLSASRDGSTAKKKQYFIAI
jgi:hypothetical protein